MKIRFLPAAAVLAVLLTMTPSPPAHACVPVIEPILEYLWEPGGGPVSICLLPDRESRGFLAGGIATEVVLRFPVALIGAAAQPDDIIPVEWWNGGPAVLCGSFVNEVTRDENGWVSLLPDLRGGGHCGPDETGDITLWIPVCPNQMLELGSAVYFNSPDINGDLRVDLSDMPLFVGDFFRAYTYRSDFNWDGQVNLSDLVMMTQGLGSSCD